MNGSSVATAAERLREPDRTRRVLAWAAPLAYVAALTAWIVADGLTLSRGPLLFWILLGLLAFSVTNARGWVRSVALEWLPFALVLSAYDFLRGHADTLLFSAHVRPQIRAEEILFAGAVPTVWLQERLWDGPGNLHWYDVATCAVYLSYFAATYLTAAFLWVVARGLFRRYVAMILLLALMGFTTYALLPAAPPWLASEYGQLEPTTRSVAVIWSEIPIPHVNTFFEQGSQYSNPVAAVPSLHAAYTLLITLVLWRLAPLWGRVLLAAYPLAMTFALVYTAEHYVVDVLLGWLYAVIAFWTVDRLAERAGRRWSPTG
ncbi:MAG TPA: phosphatase PAP2 family protein [Gaiellaceae bacterium]|nr:phosphatase PAP2 family protein [Gaiellaceae bacterium]